MGPGYGERCSRNSWGEAETLVSQDADWNVRNSPDKTGGEKRKAKNGKRSGESGGHNASVWPPEAQPLVGTGVAERPELFAFLSVFRFPLFPSHRFNPPAYAAERSG